MKITKTALTCGLILSLAFSKFIFAGVQLSDVIAIMLGFLCLLVGNRVYIGYLFFGLAFFIMNGLFVYLWVGEGNVMSLLRLLSVLFVITCFVPILSKLSLTELYYCLRRSLTIVAGIQVLLVLLFYTIDPPIFNVVLLGNENRLSETWLLNVYQTHFPGVYRFGSTFTEPSWFGAYQGFLLFFTLILSGELKIKPSKKFHLLILLSTVATTSLAAIIFYIVSYAWYYSKVSSKTGRILSISALLTGLVLLLTFIPYLQKRILLILSGNDGSFNARIFGSVEKSFFILSETSFLGAGAGNSLTWINRYFDMNTSIQNGYFEALASMGMLGFMCYIFALHVPSLKFRSLDLSVATMLVIFVTGFIFTLWHWWLAIVVLAIGRARLNRNNAEVSITNPLVGRSS